MSGAAADRGGIERRCTTKRRYGSQEHAARAAAQNGWKHREPMRPYACTDCGGWHLARERSARIFRDPPKLPGRVIARLARDRRRRR